MPALQCVCANELVKFRELMMSYQRDEALVYLSIAADAVAWNSKGLGFDYTASSLPRAEYSELTNELISIRNANKRGVSLTASNIRRSNVAYLALQRKVKRLFTADSYQKIYNP